MTTGAYTWVKIPSSVYADVFDGMGGLPRWGAFGGWTKCHSDRPHEQRTEWHLIGQRLPLLANETRNGVHTYYIAQPVEIKE